MKQQTKKFLSHKALEFKSLLIILIVMFGVRASFADQYRVPSLSMFPTLQAGDHIFVNKAAFGLRIPLTETYLLQWQEPQRGDVIVFKAPPEPTKNFVKRVAGIPGDWVWVQGQRVQVPADSYYVLGDNSSNSLDSRYWGFVPKSFIRGKALFILFNVSLESVRESMENLPHIFDRSGTTFDSSIAAQKRQNI